MEKQKRSQKIRWEAEDIQALRKHLGLTQQEMANLLGTGRQQTISEWEMGKYQPRGTSAHLITIIAERAGFRYEASPPEKVD